MRLFILILLPILSIFLQSSVFSYFSIYGVFPDILLIFVVFYALLYKISAATTYGFLCGLLEDLFVGSMIGANALAKGVAAYVISRLQVQVFKENLLVGVLGVFIATFINSLIIILISLAAGKNILFNNALLWGVSFQTLYNIVLAAPAYLIYHNSSRNGWLMLVRKDV